MVARKVQAVAMTTTQNETTIHDLIDQLADLGFTPADETGPDWVAHYFRGFAARAFDKGWLIVGDSADEVIVTVATASGVIREQIKYNAPDGYLGGFACTSLLATLREFVACD